jgi:type IV secretory pathway TrbL component
MPQAGILDGFVQGLLSIFTLGYGHLFGELWNLLSLLVGLEFMFGALAFVGLYFGVFSFFINKTIKMCIFVFLFLQFPVVTQSVIEFFIWGGLSIAGTVASGQLTVEQFQHPSIVIVKGFEATGPLFKFIKNHQGWGALFNFGTLLVVFFASIGIWVGFAIAAIHLIFALIATYAIAIYSLLFLPFGAFGPLAFLAERGIAMFIAGAARLGVLALVTAIMFPVIDQFLLPPTTPGADPGMAEAFWLLFMTALFVVASILIPAVVHMIAAGGPLLSWSNLIPGANLVIPGPSRSSAPQAGSNGQPHGPTVPRHGVPAGA